MKFNMENSFKFQELGVFLSLLAISIFMSFASPYFLTSMNIFNILRNMVSIGLLSLGMTLIIVMGGIDLSVGSTMAASAMVMARLLYMGGNPVFAILAGLLTGLIIGAVNGVIITKLNIAPFIVSLGMMQIARGLTILVATGVVGSVAANITVKNSFILYIGSAYWGPVPVSVVIFLLLVLCFMYITRHTILGRNIYAIGSNETAAHLVGIETNKVKITVYMIMGGVAFFAGLLSTGLLSAATTNSGQGIELDVVAAVVIGGGSLNGGRGTVLGTVIGAMIIAIVRNAFVLLHFPPFSQTITIGIIIILAVIVDTIRQKQN